MRISDWSSDVGSSDLMASRKWQVFATRSAACFLHVSTGSAGSCHLQAARAECRSILAHVYHLAQRADASHMRLMLIETESTPNPATLKARTSTRLNSSHSCAPRMPSSACTKKNKPN